MNSRICFYQKPICSILVPRFGIDDKGRVEIEDCSMMDLTVDDFINEIYEAEMIISTLSAWDILRIYFGGKPIKDKKGVVYNQMEVCPAGLADEEILSTVAAEIDCSDYKKLYFPGSVSEQPSILMEAFSVIRSAKARFRSDAMRRAEEASRPKPVPADIMRRR